VIADENALPQKELRLNPFALPAETKGRFRMLVVVAVMVAAILGTFVHFALRGAPAIQRLGDLSEGWPSDMRETFRLAPSQVGTICANATRSMYREFAERLPQILTQNGVLLLLFLVSCLIYLRHPRRLRKQHGARPLPGERAPRAVADLQRWALRCGIHPLPTLEYRPGLAQGLTFGLRGQEVLLLHGTPETLERTWGETSRTIALHELGHIANGDAQDQEKARAIWVSLLALVGWNVLLGMRLPGLLGLKLFFLILLVRGNWAGMLRLREFYADWRVAAWGMGDPLARILRLAEARNQRLSWLRAVHPSFHQRSEALKNPAALFRISADLPFLSGVLLALVAFNLPLFVGNWLWLIATPPRILYLKILPFLVTLPQAFKIPLWLIAGLVLNAGPTLTLVVLVLGGLCYLVTSTLGVQVQRAAIADLASGDHDTWRYFPLFLPATAFALGLELGFFLLPPNAFAPYLGRSFWLFPLWLMGFTFLTWLWMAYLRALTRLLIGSQARRDAPLLRRRFVSISGAVLLCILYLPAAAARCAIVLKAPQLHNYLGAHASTSFFYASMASSRLLTIAGGVFAVGGGTMLLIIAILLATHSARCPTCGERSSFKLAVGRICPRCGFPLALWVYFDPAQVGIPGDDTEQRQEARRSNRHLAYEILALALSLLAVGFFFATTHWLSTAVYGSAHFAVAIEPWRAMAGMVFLLTPAIVLSLFVLSLRFLLVQKE